MVITAGHLFHLDFFGDVLFHQVVVTVPLVHVQLYVDGYVKDEDERDDDQVEAERLKEHVRKRDRTRRRFALTSARGLLPKTMSLM